MNTIFLDKVLNAVADAHGVSEYNARVQFKYGYLVALFCEPSNRISVVELAQKHGVEVEA